MKRVRPGSGAAFPQRAPRDVSDISYINRFDELGDALLEMRLPIGFKAGAKMAERKFEKGRQERVRSQAADFEPRTRPDRTDWTFQAGGYTFRGADYRMQTSSRLRLLKLLATSERPVSCEQAAEALGSPKGGTSTRRVHVQISGLRQRLRTLFGLPENFDPVPCVSRGDGGAWTIVIP